MSRVKIVPILGLLCVLCGLWFHAAPLALAARLAQQPTVSIPTVTSTPKGSVVTPKTGPGAEDEINVRSGPSASYARVGVLVIGQEAPALGRTDGGDWILIAYPGAPDNIGWVYTPYVDISPPDATLSIVEPPATPTPRVTATIDPTLAAQFIREIPATRLPDRKSVV